ncbi:unnamed protein product, partial [marine sediment metagenome]
DEFQLANIAIRPTDESGPTSRVEMPILTPAERKGNFNEIELSLTEEIARKEADRCLQCGGCFLCLLLCPDGAISVQGDDHIPNVDFDICKACGICAHECPLKAIEMLPIEEQQ